MITSSSSALHHWLLTNRSDVLLTFACQNINIKINIRRFDTFDQSIINSLARSFARFVAISLYLTSYCNLISSSSSTILIVWSIYFIKHRILLKNEWLLINWMSFCLWNEYVSNSSSQACVSFDYWSEHFALASVFVSQCSTDNDKVNDSKHFFSLLFLLFSLHFIRNFIARYLLYHTRLLQFTSYCTILTSSIYRSIQRILVQVDIFFSRIEYSQQSVSSVRLQDFSSRILIF